MMDDVSSRKSFPKTLRRGLVRFAPFNVLAVALAVFTVWGNHVPWQSRSTDGVLPAALACGACWGMLAAMASRLAVERRKAGRILLNVVPVVCGLALSAAGAWFWYRVRSEKISWRLWEMLYWGGATALASAAFWCLFGERNRRTLFGQLFQSAVCVFAISLVTMFGGLLCIEAYRELIDKIPSTFFDDFMMIVWCAVAPAFMSAFLPTGDEPTERSRWYDILFWFLVPVGLILMAVLYFYVAKILIRWEMPSGKMNWFASCAIAGYLFVWLSLRASRVRLFTLLARWGWITLLPVIATQIVGIAVRYRAHGLTTPRMAGMIALALGIYALAMAALDCDARSVFAAVAIAGVVFTVSPLNIVDVPLLEQESRLRATLERNGCMDSGGRLAVPDALEIPAADAKTIVSASRYLADVYRFEFCGSGAPEPRPGVWHRPLFVKSLLSDVFVRRRDYNLPALLKIDESKFVSPEKRICSTHHDFRMDKSNAVDVSGFSHLSRAHYFKFSRNVWGCREKHCFIKFDHPLFDMESAEKEFDVSSYIDGIVKDTGADLKWGNGEYNKYRLSPELALWRLSRNVALAVYHLTLSVCQDSESISGHIECVILTAREKQSALNDSTAKSADGRVHNKNMESEL